MTTLNAQKHLKLLNKQELTPIESFILQKYRISLFTEFGFQNKAKFQVCISKHIYLSEDLDVNSVTNLLNYFGKIWSGSRNLFEITCGF